jgi:putative DNA primase/helicase
MVGHALAYARKGWPVFPVWWPSYAGVCACREGADCTDPAKHPAVSGGSTAASTDCKQIEAWWRKYPLANIAIATGAPSGLTVLDVDERHGGNESLQELIKRHGKPEPTPVALTGGGGRHVLWAWRENHRCRQEVRKGLDVRAGGGYILAAPSLHASGVRYAWHEAGHPARIAVKPAPAWVEPLLCGTSGGTRFQREPLPGGPIAEGTRNRTLFRWACRWQRLSMSDEDLANRLHDMNCKMCRPPLDDKEVEKIVGSALRYAKGAP